MFGFGGRGRVGDYGYDPGVGREYREKVIGRGGSVDAGDMIADSPGRKPNNEAFLRKVGSE